MKVSPYALFTLCGFIHLYFHAVALSPSAKETFVLYDSSRDTVLVMCGNVYTQSTDLFVVYNFLGTYFCLLCCCFGFSSFGIERIEGLL